MIKFNNSDINDWNFDNSNIIKVYHNGAVVFYKFDAEQGGQTPCFAVVEDITQYQDTEFEDVFNKADGKWYKLNNLVEYEEYGIYGSGRSITYYDGKLTIDGDYEYQYSGGSWVNVGEVSGSSRIPLNFTEVEYVENTTNAYINTRMYLYDSTTNSYTIQCKHYFQSYSRDFEYLFGTEGTSSPYVGMQLRYYRRNLQYSSSPDNVSWTHIDNGDGTSGITASCSSTTATNGNNPLTLFCGLWSTGPWRNGRGKIYSFKVTKNNGLIRDLVPCKRNSDDMVGMYDVVNEEFYYPPNYQSYQLVAGPTVTSSTEYPIYYDEIQDPPNNLSFSSMTEAEEYECPWVGMQATIDGVKYVFSGDSQSGYEWVEQGLPYDAEIQYLENSGTEYINTGVYLNTSNFEIGYTILGDRGCWGYVHQMVVNGAWVTVSNDYAYFGTFETKVAVSSYLSPSENTIVYTQSGITVNGTNLSKNLNLKGVDNLNSVSLPLFAWYDFNSMSADVNFNSKFKSFYVKNNGVLVRDMIPVRVGQVGYMYDRVSGQLFGNAGTGSFILGPDVN